MDFLGNPMLRVIFMLLPSCACVYLYDLLWLEIKFSKKISILSGISEWRSNGHTTVAQECRVGNLLVSCKRKKLN